MVTSTGLSAKMGAEGWYFESWRAVAPDSVNSAMPRRSRSSAAWAVASQMVSAMERWLRALARLGVALLLDVQLGLGDDARHHGDGLNRILAHGRLAGEHDGVGAVVDGVGHVGDFGARGARVFDHRLQHLRRRDDRLANTRRRGE